MKTRIIALLSLVGLLAVLASFTTLQNSIEVSGIVSSAADGAPLPGVAVRLKGTGKGVTTDIDGKYTISVPSNNSILEFSFIGFATHEEKVGQRTKINVVLQEDLTQLDEVVVTGLSKSNKGRKAEAEASSPAVIIRGKSSGLVVRGCYTPSQYLVIEQGNTEEYAEVEEIGFKRATEDPLSTFSIDVDRASYSNLRRFIQDGQQPPAEAVRIEEMVNYFNYEYEQPKGDDPFSVYTELVACPWNSKHQLLHIGLQGKIIPTENLPASNLVFLLDVSGSMNSADKLPLLKSGFKMLVNQLRDEDKVSIVVYAGAAGVVLEPTSGKDKARILDALEKLTAGGSTAGGAGIQKAYELAERHFIQGGNNRVILATDGDFNVGVNSPDGLEKLIEKKRESGIFLTVLGFGTGNYKDNRMEVLADKGNGNYAYIDNLLEAKKTLVSEFGGTLFTIAKDVKLQLEFNPAYVQGYRLIGYENRMLAAEDFNNDKKDAGELGSGHTVTALYEIVPAGVEDSPYLGSVDDLKYQRNEPKVENKGLKNGELLTVKLRYKKPDEDKSRRILHVVSTRPVNKNATSENFRFSAAVAQFGMILQESEYSGDASYSKVLALGKGAQGKDEEGYRAEFLNLVRRMELVAER